MKLQQFIAHSGLSSRRKAVEFIEQGRVYVNGVKITDVTARVDSSKDHVKVDGKLLQPEKKVYIVMNKPEGCVTTVSDEEGRRTVMNVLDNAIPQRIYPVGRLDFNTTGCLILTNDGDLANRIMHPKFEILKRYEAKITGRLAPETAARLKRGVKYEGIFYKAVDAGVYRRGEANDRIFIVVKEGMNHQVRLMLKAVGAPPVWLHRASVGPVNVKGMEYGQWRWMTQEEINYFRRG
ncbi:MAG: rRNA pseudouridine synthase [Spirochaetia bacterium]|nr:rRNA pseudouridine synthase [Spirochaetia bacterium]